MSSRTIRVDAEVYEALVRERRSGERNFNDAIWRLLERELARRDDMNFGQDREDQGEFWPPYPQPKRPTTLPGRPR